MGSGYLRPDQFLDHLTVIKGGGWMEKSAIRGGKGPPPTLNGTFFNVRQSLREHLDVQISCEVN